MHATLHESRGINNIAPPAKSNRKTRFTVEYVNPRDESYMTLEHDIRHDDGKQRFINLMLWATSNDVELRIRPTGE